MHAEARRCAAEAASLQADVPDLAALEEAIRFAEDPAARQARMDALLADVGRSINRGEWEAADAFLQAAEAIDPADPRIRIGRSRVDPEIAKGMPPEVCAERIWKAVESDRQEVVVAGKEVVAMYIKRFLPLPWYTAFARRIHIN